MKGTTPPPQPIPPYKTIYNKIMPKFISLEKQKLKHWHHFSLMVLTKIKKLNRAKCWHGYRCPNQIPEDVIDWDNHHGEWSGKFRTCTDYDHQSYSWAYMPYKLFLKYERIHMHRSSLVDYLCYWRVRGC